VVAFGLVIQFQGGLTIVSSQRFDIMGVLALFLCLNAFIGFAREKSLRQTFLSEYLLYANEQTLITQQTVSNDLLQAMLPLPVIKQVGSGRAAWACGVGGGSVCMCRSA
jgi:hypothetical protein